MIDLEQRLAQAWQDEPPLPPVGPLVVAARRRLRRRRALGAAGLVAAVGIAGVGSSALLRASELAVAHDRPSTSEPEVLGIAWAPPLPRTAADFLNRCSEPRQSDPEYDARLLDGGATVVAHTMYALGAMALLVSADGEFWGRCGVYPGQPDATLLTVFRDPTPPLQGNGLPHTDGITYCGDSLCAEATVLATRLPAAVAYVQVAYDDGAVDTAPTRDGWVAMSHTVLGEDATQDREGMAHRVTYLDTGRAPLAEWVADVTERDRSMPGLDAYPSLFGGAPLGHIPGWRED